MDPITTAIVAALTIGVTTGVTKFGESVIVDAYNSLKNALQNKFGKDSKLIQAVNQLETEPNFKPNKSALAGRVAQSQADKDREILQAAKMLLDTIQNNSKVATAIGVNLNEIKVASLTIDDIIATGSGVNVTKLEASGDMSISHIKAGANQVSKL